MKLFSILALVACLALVGCEQKPAGDAGTGTGTGAGTTTNAAPAK